MDTAMNDVAGKKPYIILLTGLLITLFVMSGVIQLGHAQTNLQELNNRVAELENKLADAKARQEKAYDVQMKLEEQEQKLSSLPDSEKYRVQAIEIRADIKNIRTKIEAITKEKNDLEENLRLARNLQTILSEERAIAKPGIKAQTTPVQEKKSNQTGSTATAKSSIKPVITPVITDIEPKRSWRMENIKISNHFNDDERNEIFNNFSSGIQINQDDLLKGAYQVYSRVGASLRFIIYPKNGNVADLEILLGQREDNANSYFTYFTPMSLGQFKSERFNIMVAK